MTNDSRIVTDAPIKDSPMAHQGSGGAGDDRQDNSAASESRPPSGANRPESRPKGPSDSANKGPEMSESDPE